MNKKVRRNHNTPMSQIAKTVIKIPDTLWIQRAQVPPPNQPSRNRKPSVYQPSPVRMQTIPVAAISQ